MKCLIYNLSLLFMTTHQQKQIEIISQIEEQIKSDSLRASAVIPVTNFDTDTRMCLTGVHFPHQSFINSVYSTITQPLQILFPNAYYYTPSSLHLTIKNIRVINDPPTYTDSDIEIAKEVFSSTIPIHKRFSIYPYRLLLFKNNLTLISTTDEELDLIICNLTKNLMAKGIFDDKNYVNSRYFFCNMTIARFSDIPSEKFISAVCTISLSLNIPIYTVDSVSLITGNAVMKKLTIYGKWHLLT